MSKKQKQEAQDKRRPTGTNEQRAIAHLEMAEEHLARASDRNSFDAQNVVATQAVAHATLALAYFAAIEHGKTVLANADAPPG